jgi:hypothetical protein
MRERTIAIALAACCLLAGCASAPGAPGTESPSQATTVEPVTSAAEDSPTATTGAADSGDDDSSDDESVSTDDAADESSTETTTTTAGETTTTTTAGETTTETATGGDADATPVDAGVLASDAAGSLAKADGVVVAGNLTRELRTASGSRTVEVAFVERVDAADRAVGVERTVTANGRTVETATYLVDGTVFERSPAYERQYGTEWIELDAGERAWANTSSTAVVSRLVNASTVSVQANATVDGERAVVLALDVDLAELEALSGFVVDEETVNALDGTITVDPDTGRVHAATVHVNRTVENSYGQEVTVVTTITREFRTYGPVTVTVPAAADDATPINATVV